MHSFIQSIIFASGPRGSPGNAVMGVDYEFILIGRILFIPLLIFMIYFGYREYEKRKRNREQNKKP